jgi:hypothetical protein
VRDDLGALKQLGFFPEKGDVMMDSPEIMELGAELTRELGWLWDFVRLAFM